MTRGNQRDTDRKRAAARKGNAAKKTVGDPSAKREADAKALQEKIARKKAQAEQGGSNSGGKKK